MPSILSRIAFPGALILAASTTSLTGTALAQDAARVPGSGTGITLGFDNKTHLRGELSHVFSGDDRSAWIGEAWFGKDVGGVKLNRHWLLDRTGGQGYTVGKLFGAWDRNAAGDQKLTLGGGQEREHWFWGAYGAFGLTDRREVGTTVSSSQETISGTDPALGPYLQNITTTTTTRLFEKAYDHGVGARIGTYLAPQAIRLTAGLDHEWGKTSASQTTFSIGAEKFFANRPYSVLLNLATSDKRGEFETLRNDHRVGVYFRYEFDHPARTAARKSTAASALPAQPAFAPATLDEPVAAQDPVRRDAPAAAPALATIDVLFELGKATLSEQSKTRLRELAGKAAAAEGTYRIVATGHTCDLGNERFNQRLSEERAGNVRDYLVEQGLAGDRIAVEGRGELAPKYPNTRANRAANRRCEVALTITPPTASPVLPATPAATEIPARPQAAEMAAPASSEAQPAWVARAIYNTVRHKQEVDVYRTREQSVTTSAGDRTYINRPPQAVNDALAWFGSRMPAIVDVLANDTDPDGDRLTVISVTNGANGVVSIRPDGRLDYVVRRGWEGIDRFNYTISDGKGGTSTAMVTIQIIDP